MLPAEWAELKKQAKRTFTGQEFIEYVARTHPGSFGIAVWVEFVKVFTCLSDAERNNYLCYLESSRTFDRHSRAQETAQSRSATSTLDRPANKKSKDTSSREGEDNERNEPSQEDIMSKVNSLKEDTMSKGNSLKEDTMNRVRHLIEASEIKRNLWKKFFCLENLALPIKIVNFLLQVIMLVPYVLFATPASRRLSNKSRKVYQGDFLSGLLLGMRFLCIVPFYAIGLLVRPVDFLCSSILKEIRYLVTFKYCREIVGYKQENRNHKKTREDLPKDNEMELKTGQGLPVLDTCDSSALEVRRSASSPKDPANSDSSDGSEQKKECSVTKLPAEFKINKKSHKKESDKVEASKQKSTRELPPEIKRSNEIKKSKEIEKSDELKKTPTPSDSLSIDVGGKIKESKPAARLVTPRYTAIISSKQDEEVVHDTQTSTTNVSPKKKPHRGRHAPLSQA